MNINEFTELLVGITPQGDEEDCWGHYPFQMHVEKSDGKASLNALALNDIGLVYEAVSQQISQKDFKQVCLSIDFPAGGDMENDFVGIFSITKIDSISNGFEAVALPYNTETGEVYPIIEKSDLLAHISNQMQNFLLGE